MPPKGFRSISIPEPMYRMIEEARREIVRNGLNGIPVEIQKALESTRCPRCSARMEKIKSRFALNKCPKCGLEKPHIEFGADHSVTLTFVLGILLCVGLMSALRRSNRC